MSHKQNDIIADAIIEQEPSPQEKEEFFKRMEIETAKSTLSKNGYEVKKKTIFNDRDRFYSFITQKNGL